MSKDPQIALATEFGLIYKQLYVVSFKDPNYPCDCECHLPNSSMLHCMPCCYNRSFGPIILQYNGVYQMTREDEIQVFFVFIRRDGHEIIVRHNELPSIRHPATLKHCTITLHRGTFESKLKKRHNPKDQPIDCAAIYAAFGEGTEHARGQT
jgi:hypothetical protein